MGLLVKTHGRGCGNDPLVDDCCHVKVVVVVIGSKRWSRCSLRPGRVVLSCREQDLIHVFPEYAVIWRFRDVSRYTYSGGVWWRRVDLFPSRYYININVSVTVREQQVRASFVIFRITFVEGGDSFCSNLAVGVSTVRKGDAFCAQLGERI